MPSLRLPADPAAPHAPGAPQAAVRHAFPPSGWRPELALRMRRLFLLKLFGTSGVIGVFFAAYFAVLRNPAHPVFMMPLTAIDHLVPFQPRMLYAYLSLWVYVGLAPGLLLTVRELLLYALWAIGLALAGLGLFYWWPTAVPPLPMGVSELAGFQTLRGMDASGNACPSLHVAFAVMSFAWIDSIVKRARAPVLLRAANLLWFLAIVWSTVAIRQHVVLDVAAGALVGAVFAVLSLRFHRDPWRRDALVPPAE
jgi:membrane-associated phospholipid phosphatase